MKDIAEKRRGNHSMNRACEISHSCMIGFSHHQFILSLSLQVVLRRDLFDGSYSDHLLSPIPSGSLPPNVHMAHTNYKILSLSALAPKRSCLLLIQPITGNYWEFPHSVVYKYGHESTVYHKTTLILCVRFIYLWELCESSTGRIYLYHKNFYCTIHYNA